MKNAYCLRLKKIISYDIYYDCQDCCGEYKCKTDNYLHDICQGDTLQYSEVYVKEMLKLNKRDRKSKLERILEDEVKR